MLFSRRDNYNMGQKGKVHILYEYMWDMNPFGTSQIRLLRPFSHPKISQYFQVSSGPEYYGQDVDVVILDRLWRPDISLNLAKSLLNDIRKKKAKFVYAIDDNLLDLPSISEEKKEIIRYFLMNADQVWVTTQCLMEKFSKYSSNIEIISNCIDDRMIDFSNITNPKNFEEITIGYMGTPTHHNDFNMIIPALEKISNKSQSKIKLQVIGITDKSGFFIATSKLPIEFINIPMEKVPYENFLPWFVSNFKWDIGLAPLMDTDFNRCKSDIKFLDYALLPSAIICSNVPAYQSVKNLETGLLVNNNIDEWKNALELLIWNNHLRSRIKFNSRTYLLKYRTIEKNYMNWVQVLLPLIGKPNYSKQQKISLNTGQFKNKHHRLMS